MTKIKNYIDKSICHQFMSNFVLAVEKISDMIDLSMFILKYCFCQVAYYYTMIKFGLYLYITDFSEVEDGELDK